VTGPEATDADRQEQLRTAVADGPELAGVGLLLTATPGGTTGARPGDVEADEFDVLEQQADAGGDEDEFRS
jgi:hypothetical protein